MFKKTKEQIEEKRYVCDICGCLLSGPLNEVKAKTLFLSGGSYDGVLYYCNTHKKLYQRKSINFLHETFYKEVEVDEQGVPVGYQLIKSK